MCLRGAIKRLGRRPAVGLWAALEARKPLGLMTKWTVDSSFTAPTLGQSGKMLSKTFPIGIRCLQTQIIGRKTQSDQKWKAFLIWCESAHLERNFMPNHKFNLFNAHIFIPVMTVELPALCLHDIMTHLRLCYRRPFTTKWQTWPKRSKASCLLQSFCWKHKDIHIVERPVAWKAIKGKLYKQVCRKLPEAKFKSKKNHWKSLKASNHRAKSQKQ